MATNLNKKRQQTRPTFLTRIGQHAGDNSQQFGQVFGNINIKKVYQLLSTSAVIVIIIASILSISLAGGWYWWYQLPTPPDKMTGDFNIAVAEFGEVTDDGTVVSSKIAKEISQELFDFLESEYRQINFGPGLNIEIAHKNMPILGEDQEAAELALEIDADVVIYGRASTRGNRAKLLPKFYVANREADIQSNTRELTTGIHRLDLPIIVDTTLFDYDELQSKASILLSFTVGLVYLSSDELSNALYYYQDAAKKANNYGDFSGKETLYLFSALANYLQDNFEQANKDLDQAFVLNPEYARAYIARGNIHYIQALKMGFDANKLQQALVEYEKALKAQDQPIEAYIKEKVNISMGNVYVIRAQQEDDLTLFSKAIHHYNQVVTQYAENGNKDEIIRGMVVTAYFGLGAAYERQKNYAQATESYKQCINLANDEKELETKTRCENQIAHIYVIRGQQENDPELFKQAIYHYNQIVARYGKTEDDKIKEIAAIAYSGLGNIYEQQNDYVQAMCNYRQCVGLTTEEHLKSQCQDKITLIEE